MSDDDARLARRIADLMPEILDEFKAMIAIPSVVFPAFPPEPVHKMAGQAVAAFRRYGVPARLQEVPGGYPAVWGEIPAPPGTPTVLLYGHYDVQPAPMEQGWTTDPWTPIERDGRIYGRGAADDKSGVAIHAGTLAASTASPRSASSSSSKARRRRSHLEAYVEANPDLFKADVMIIADMGNIACGEPVLTTMLRGHVQCIVEVTHGRPPAALGRVRRPRSGRADGAHQHARDAAGRHTATAPFPGSSVRLAGRRVPRAALPPDGRDARRRRDHRRRHGAHQAVEQAVHQRHRHRRAVGRRGRQRAAAVGPCEGRHAHRSGADPDDGPAGSSWTSCVPAPWGVQVEVTSNKKSPPFAQSTDASAFQLMRTALERTYGERVELVGSGGSIPLLAALRAASPGADFVLTGAEDAALSRIHGPDESVDPAEIERMALAQARLLVAVAG